jgi:hypothetical protein
MKIIKKLLLIIPFIFNIQFAIQAYYATLLKQELQSIASFTQKLRQQNNNAQAQALAAWLESKVLDTSNTTNNDIIALAIIANKHESKTQSQITILSKKFNYAAAYIFVATLASIATGFFILTNYDQYIKSLGWN